MAWLHTWAGLLPGWVLFVIFLFGTVAFFQPETSRWMRPELPSHAVTGDALNAAMAYLTERAPGAESWDISLPPARGGAPLSVSWQPMAGSGIAAGGASLDPATGQEITVRDTLGGWFLYRFHYDLHYMPLLLARYIVCVSALAMLVAILSGIVTHKKIFADFFTLRFGKGQRSWLDAHNVAGVLALPFHLMITYTGLVGLLFTLMPWAISANFPSEGAFYEVAYPPAPKVEASGKAASVLPLPALLARAGFDGRAGMPGYISISHPGDAASVVAIYPARTRLGGEMQALYLSGATGEPLQPLRHPGPASATQNIMIDLHTGLFAGSVLRWLYFLSGASGTAMIASGLVLWIVKRRAKLPDPARPHFGFRLVERLNIGVMAGAPAGIAVYFLANRLLPLGLDRRADWEINSLFIAWGGLFVWSIARPATRAWIEALTVCAALYALVPIVSAFTTTRGLIPSLWARDWVFVGFDLTMLATAAVFTLAAWKVAAHKPKAAHGRVAARPPVEAAV